jgi:hypothetical protein
MKSVRIGLSVAALIFGTWAHAQGNTSGQAAPGSANGQNVAPDQASKSMNHAADAGAGNGNAQGSLMQKRSNAMSPQGGSAPGATGTMKQ